MTTPTSEERREVAERLRRLDVSITSRDTLEGAVDKFITAVYGGQPFSPVSYSVRNSCGLGYALADLIDPTCHAEQDYDCDEPVQGRWWRCGACGERFAYERGLSPRFCPECGARLVSE